MIMLSKSKCYLPCEASTLNPAYVEGDEKSSGFKFCDFLAVTPREVY